MVNEKQTNNTNNFSMQNIVKKRYIENDPTLCFDTIPIYKIIILTLVTTGLYQFILFYSWWKSLKLNFGYKVSPFWRAYFMGISVFWLFPIFEKYFNVFNIKDFKAGTYALLFFFACLLFNCIESSDSSDNISLQILVRFLIIGFTAICCYIQNKINSINTRHYPQAKNNNWNLSNTIWTIICSIILILPLILGNNIKQENDVQNQNISNEQITNMKILDAKQARDFDKNYSDAQNKQSLNTNTMYASKYNDEKQFASWL